MDSKYLSHSWIKPQHCSDRAVVGPPRHEMAVASISSTSSRLKASSAAVVPVSTNMAAIGRLSQNLLKAAALTQTRQLSAAAAHGEQAGQ